MMFKALAVMAGAVASASAAAIDVKVGSGGLNFQPNSMTANIGDTLVFHFYSGAGSHSVVSSSFDTPCKPNSNAFYSGTVQGNSAGDKTFSVNVTSTSPIWLYCSVGSHCQSGMVAVVNPPSGQGQAAYASAAQSVSDASAPSSIGGGALVTGGASSTGGSSTAVSSAMSSASSGSMSMTSGSSSASRSGSATSSAAAGGATTSASSSRASSAASTTTSGSAAGSASAAATTTRSGAGAKEMNVLMGLGVVLGGLVALMA